MRFNPQCQTSPSKYRKAVAVILVTQRLSVIEAAIGLSTFKHLVGFRSFGIVGSSEMHSRHLAQG